MQIYFDIVNADYAVYEFFFAVLLLDLPTSVHVSGDRPVTTSPISPITPPTPPIYPAFSTSKISGAKPIISSTLNTQNRVILAVTIMISLSLIGTTTILLALLVVYRHFIMLK